MGKTSLPQDLLAQTSRWLKQLVLVQHCCAALIHFNRNMPYTGTGRENHAHQVGHAVLCNACVPEMLKLQCATGKASPQQQDLFAQISRCSSDVRFFLHCCAWRTA